MGDVIKEYAISINDASDNAGTKWAGYDPDNGEKGNFILKKICHLLVDVSLGEADKTIPLYGSWLSVVQKIGSYHTDGETAVLKKDITFPNNSEDKNDNEFQREVIFGLKACISAYYGLLIPDFLTLTITKENTAFVSQSSNDNKEFLIRAIGISYGKTDDNLPEGIDIDSYKASGLSDDRWG